MANEERIITDPLGNQVRISPSLCDVGLQATHYETFDDALDVIRRPIMVIELTDSPTLQLCYYRSISWDTTLLIMTKKTDDEWEAYRCIKNATPQTISELLKKGNQLI
jgi:hypothetical protein